MDAEFAGLEIKAAQALPAAEKWFDRNHTSDGAGRHLSTGSEAEASAEALRVLAALSRGEGFISGLYATRRNVEALLSRLLNDA